MPDDVAVKRPDARVPVKLHDEMAVAPDDVDVPPVGVGRAGDDAVPVAWPFVQDVGVVAVEVHWVTLGRNVSYGGRGGEEGRKDLRSGGAVPHNDPN